VALKEDLLPFHLPVVHAVIMLPSHLEVRVTVDLDTVVKGVALIMTVSQGRMITAECMAV
jgi:hypothetical protein